MNDFDVNTIKKALIWYMETYGCELSCFIADDEIEYSCNEHDIESETHTALANARQIVDFWED